MGFAEDMSECIVTTVSADGLAPNGSRSSADTMMTKFDTVYVRGVCLKS